jgi:hypothetical protein
MLSRNPQRKLKLETAWNFTHADQSRVREQIHMTLKTPSVAFYIVLSKCVNFAIGIVQNILRNCLILLILTEKYANEPVSRQN